MGKLIKENGKLYYIVKQEKEIKKVKVSLNLTSKNK